MSICVFVIFLSSPPFTTALAAFPRMSMCAKVPKISKGFRFLLQVQQNLHDGCVRVRQPGRGHIPYFADADAVDDVVDEVVDAISSGFMMPFYEWRLK